MKALIILFSIFITVFCMILLARFILNVALDRAYKNFQKLKSLAKRNPYSKKKNYIKEEDELLLEKIEFPRAHSEMKAEFKAKQSGRNIGNRKYEIIESKNKDMQQESDEIDIVGIVKPVGFWTSMILGQKLTYLVHSAQIINKRGDKGFWASMIEAKEKAAGRQHSRGR